MGEAVTGWLLLIVNGDTILASHRAVEIIDGIAVSQAVSYACIVAHGGSDLDRNHIMSSCIWLYLAFSSLFNYLYKLANNICMYVYSSIPVDDI